MPAAGLQHPRQDGLCHSHGREVVHFHYAAHHFHRGVLYCSALADSCVAVHQVYASERIPGLLHKPGDAVSVYIKSILPEKMKIKLVIIGICKKENAGRAVPRFPIEEAEHIERWTYSPPGCVREIGTVFDGDPDAAL